MKYTKSELSKAVLLHPLLAVRHLCGLDASAIGLGKLSRWIKNPAPTIIEAGAFNGDDTLRFITRWPQASIYAFEPIPELGDALALKFEPYKEIHVVKEALVGYPSRQIEMHSFDANAQNHGSSSILPPSEHLEREPSVQFSRRILVNGLTGDDWLETVSLDRIDLLWLDLQGAELEVLTASRKILEITEVCHVEVSTRRLYEGAALYGEIFDFMVSMGFQLKLKRILGITGNAVFVKS
jgi:FkbM family methyltransferase